MSADFSILIENLTVVAAYMPKILILWNVVTDVFFHTPAETYLKKFYLLLMIGDNLENYL
jgi:hypothetical protein